jgi:imidazolonepropionase
MSGVAVLNIGQLVTLRGPARPRIRSEMRDLAIVPDGAMLISGDRIERTGSSAEIEPLIGPGDRVIDAECRVVLPGFVDAHAHPVFAATRVEEYELRSSGATYEQIAASGGGIRSTVRKTRAASEDELFSGALRRTQWFLRTGTTTMEAKSGYGLSLEAELKMLRVIRRLNGQNRVRFVPTFLGAHEVPDEYRGNPAAYLELLIHEMLPAVAHEKLAEYCDIFCEPKVFQLPAARRYLETARSFGFGLRVHADQLERCGASELAAELGAATADHLEQIDDTCFAALVAAGVQPVLLPGSVYNLGLKRYAPARAMIDAGLAVVLATDFNPGSSPTPSIPFVLSLACTQTHMTPAEAVTAATINAAYSLGRGPLIGSLEPGKRADFVIHDCADYREIPYFSGLEPAAETWIGGRLVYSRKSPESVLS